MKEWQPIETAPTDGTEFLASRHGEMRVTWGDDGEWKYAPNWHELWKPTHWLSLSVIPSPPKPRMNEWQPIETAPRDAAQVHVFGTEWYSDIDGHKEGPVQAIATFEPDPEAGEGYDWEVVASSYRRTSIKATHWRAVPEDPR